MKNTESFVLEVPAESTILVDLSINTYQSLMYEKKLAYKDRVFRPEGGFISAEPRAIEDALCLQLVAPHISYCHVVLVREVNSEKIWMAHVTKAEVLQLSNTPYAEMIPPPAYIQFSAAFNNFNNQNCPQGAIDVIVINGTRGVFDEAQLRRRLPANCFLRKLSYYAYDNKNNIFQVVYSPADNIISVTTNNKQADAMKIENAFQRTDNGIAIKLLSIFPEHKILADTVKKEIKAMTTLPTVKL